MNTTMNTGGASLSDEQILDVLCRHDERPFHRPHGTRLVYNAFEDEYDLREIVLRRVRELIALAAPTPQADAAPIGAMTRTQVQGKAIEHGFQYWRAPDAHGVTGTKPQAIELLQDLLGVEVEIEDNGCQTCNGTGMIGGPSYYAPDEGGQPCPDCAAIAAGGAQEPVAWMVLAANTRKPCEVTLHKSETEALRQDCVIPLYAAPLPREAANVPQIKPRLLSQLRRFNECCEDCDAGGHDVDKEDMHSLAELGAVRPAPGGRHYMTDFGHYLLAAASNGEKK